MADFQFLRLNDGSALAYDSRQWIVQRRSGIRNTGDHAGQKIWTALSFIANEKTSLFRVLREKGVVPTHEAQSALDALPDTFREFYAAITERPKVAAGELFEGVAAPRGGGAERDEAA
jgi:hypothetical protein